MPMTELPTHDSDRKQWRSNEFTTIDVAQFEIPPQLSIEGMSVLMLDHAIPVENHVDPITRSTITAIVSPDVSIDISIPCPQTYIVLQHDLDLGSITTHAQHLSNNGGGWETEISHSFKFSGAYRQSGTYFSWGMNHRQQRFFVASESTSGGAHINLGRRLDIIKPIGYRRLAEWFSIPTVVSPEVPFFDFSDVGVFYVYIKNNGTIDLQHVWVNQKDQTILIDGYFPSGYERLIRETRRIDR